MSRSAAGTARDVDIANFGRNIALHIRGILVGSLLVGVLAAAVGLLMPATYTAEATVRVINNSAQPLDPEALATAVNWYAALGVVPAIAAQAGVDTRPPMSAADVLEHLSLQPGVGPGEMQVVARSGDQQQAVSLSDAMTAALVQRVSADSQLAWEDTSLSVLVPAQVAGRAGGSPATLFVTGVLLAFVVFATAAGLLHDVVNWRLKPRFLHSLAQDCGISAFDDMDSLAVQAALRSREGNQTWMASGPGVTEQTWADLLERVRNLGAPVEVLSINGEPEQVIAGRGQIFVPTHNDAGPLSLTAVSRMHAPVLVLCPPRQRSKELRGFLDRLQSVGVRPFALALGTTSTVSAITMTEAGRQTVSS